MFKPLIACRIKILYSLRNEVKHNLKPLRGLFRGSYAKQTVTGCARKAKTFYTNRGGDAPSADSMGSGEATVEEVVSAHAEKERPNYKTTQTLLRIMEQKGFITHENRGRVFVFRPLVSRKTIDDLSVQALVSRNFNGSAAGLLINLLEASPIKKNELDELEAYIQEYRKRSEPGEH